MSTETIELTTPGEYHLLAAAGEDFIASNETNYEMHLMTGDKPADLTVGHPIEPHGRIYPYPSIAGPYWIMCSRIGAKVKKN